jgi:tetratricopeptide (TPR) repeat protein
MGLLLLESLLGLSIGRNTGLDHERIGCPSAATIIEWLESLDAEQDPHLKFLLALYKSRVDLTKRDGAGIHLDSKVRSARKELKSAMEVFQQKLRPSFGAETGSVVSSANSEENSMLYSHEHQQQQLPTSLVLQKCNQSALSLKANLEQLKGNTKKSLILCSEAQSAAKDDGSYDTVHSNNLAVVYETIDKRHLALHALTKSLRANADVSVFHDDGTARPNLTLAVLHNAAICALQAKNYLSAYECMAACVMGSDVFCSRPRCWLRISEACIGRFNELRRLKMAKFATVEING